MSTRKSSNRYTLLMYRRSWDRMWKSTLLLGAALGILWWQAGSRQLPIIPNANSLWVLLGASFSLLMGLFGLLARNMSYVQAYPSHLRIVTPFLKLNVSYRRVISIRTVDVVQLFPPGEQKWARRRFLQPFYAKTGIAVETRGYPLLKNLLRLFLPRQVCLPQATGFLLLVEDWMKLSTELDSRIGTWHSYRQQGPPDPGLLESIRQQNKRW